MIPVLMLLLLLAMPSISIQGASGGLLLWFNVVLPTLAPFMICTQLVTMFGGIAFLMRPFAPLFHRLFRLSPSGGYVLLCGLLCGYPLGAKLCADFYHRGQITESEANYLLSICNHPSPIFLLGYVRNQLPVRVPSFLIPLCLYLPVIPLSWISRRFYHAGVPAHNSRSSKEVYAASVTKRLSLEGIFMSTCDTLVIIGCYIMLFSIFAAWVDVIPLLSEKGKALICGALEITTGIHKICACGAFSLPLLPVVATVAFGGFSGIFQTKSVLQSASKTDPESGNAKNAGLSIRHYLFWKLLHLSFSCITFLLLQPVLLP